MKVTHCMFDFDGTLFYTLDDIMESLRRAFAKNDIPMQAMDVATVMQLQLREAVAACAPGTAPERIDAVIRDFKEAYDASDYPATRLMTGAKELLEALRSREIGMTIVSNKRQAPTKRILEKFGLTGFFEAVYNPDMFADTKMPTKSWLIAHAIEQNRLSPKTTAYIGDSEIDVISARENELISIIVQNGYGNVEKFHTLPTCVVKGLSSILPLFGPS